MYKAAIQNKENELLSKHDLLSVRSKDGCTTFLLPTVIVSPKKRFSCSTVEFSYGKYKVLTVLHLK